MPVLLSMYFWGCGRIIHVAEKLETKKSNLPADLEIEIVGITASLEVNSDD